MIARGSSAAKETTTDRKKNPTGHAHKQNRAMRIDRAARTLLGVAALCWLLVNAGCNGATSSSGIAGVPNTTARVDWGVSLLANGTVGVGQFPAKFTFDVNAAADCTNDFVAFNTSLAGVSPTAAASSGGNAMFNPGPANGGTFTITHGAATLTLTAASDNTGNDFLVVSGDSDANAASLAARIAALGGPVGVTASASANVVTVTALTNGSEGNSITLASTLTSFGLGTTPLTGGLGTGNIVAFNKLYSTQGSAGGLCNQDGPSAYWSYYTGTGQALTSVVLSGDGTKVAFVENAGGGATLRILQWKAGEGTAAGYPAGVDQDISGSAWSTCTGGNSCMASIAFNGGAQDTKSAPFYNYPADILYVGDNNGKVHKFTGVFNGTPTEVTSGWPMTVNSGTTLTSPIYDSVSGNIFVGDNTGRLSFIREAGSTAGTCTPLPCLDTTNLAVGTGGAIDDAPVVDGTNGTVLAFNGNGLYAVNEPGVVLQATTALTGSVSFYIGGNISIFTCPDSICAPIYSGAFDNAYFTSPSTGHMYVCGKDNSQPDMPAIYQLSFNISGTLTSVGTPLLNMTQTSAEACSPVTEVYNPDGGGTGVPKDWIFLSVAEFANHIGPIPAGSPCQTVQHGCLISLDVTDGTTWDGSPGHPPALLTNAVVIPPSPYTAGKGSRPSATSGIVVDNVSTGAQASSIYFSLTNNSTGAGSGLPSCNTTAGVGCAVKLTQSALQ
ncbi:MAG: hypothetical protein LAN18_06600 [Acidobacteriia bacterium]|nr:hypothetical protein [Terriglobia bacterium]